MSDLAHVAGEYFDAWWRHHHIWKFGEIPSSDFDAANVKLGELASRLRMKMKIGALGLLPQPSNCDRQQYIDRIAA